MILKPGALTLEDLQALHQGGLQLALDPAALPAIEASAAVVQRAAAGEAPVYGVNTGFGKLASTRIGADDLATLQLNLIRSHSVGVGQPMAPAVVRLILALKAALKDSRGVVTGEMQTSFDRASEVYHRDVNAALTAAAQP